MDDGFVVEGRSEYYQYPYILRSEIVKAPEWFLNAVVYNIFPGQLCRWKKAPYRRAEGTAGTSWNG